MTKTMNKQNRRTFKRKQTRSQNKKQKQNKLRNMKRQTRQRTRQDKRKSQKKRRTLRKQRNRKQKNMKGGAIPFSELGNVLDSTQYMLSKAVAPFTDSAVPVAGNPKDIVNPDPTKQFLRIPSVESQLNPPNLPRHFDNAFS